MENIQSGVTKGRTRARTSWQTIYPEAWLHLVSTSVEFSSICDQSMAATFSFPEECSVYLDENALNFTMKE